MLAPVIIFVYNRPEHIRKTIGALSKNKLAKDTNVFIFSDGAKNKEAYDKVQEVRDYLKTIEQGHNFKSVTIKLESSNKGLANSVIDGVSEIIDQTGKVIVVEDDLITTPDFLEYMNDALLFYSSIKKVWSISGYNIPISIPESYKHDVYYSYRGSSWGWATWKDRWTQVDWQVKDYSEFRENKYLRKQFNRGGRDMSRMLISQMEGEIDSWAIRWCYSQSKRNLLTVYPVKSRLQNIGLDGSGTHKAKTGTYDVIVNNEFSKCNFSDPEMNDVILRNFKDNYGSRRNDLILSLKIRLKKFLNR